MLAAARLLSSCGANIDMSDLVKKIEQGDLSFPSARQQYRHAQTLDIMNMLHQRAINKKWYVPRWLTIDSSPQLGHDFLIVKERRALLPMAFAPENFSSEMSVPEAVCSFAAFSLIRAACVSHSLFEGRAQGEGCHRRWIVGFTGGGRRRDACVAIRLRAGAGEHGLVWGRHGRSAA